MQDNITTPIIKQIEEMAAKIPGWSPIDQLYSLFNLIFLNDTEGDIIEVGSWCGRSAGTMALAAKLNNRDQKVYCVDLFPEKDDWYQNPDKSWSFKTKINNKDINAYNIQTVWDEPFSRDIAPLYEKYNGILDIFNECMAKNNFSEIVIPFKGDFETFADKTEDLTAKLIFLDGDHSYSAVCKDIEYAERFLVKDGWICFDDAFSSYEGVNQAIKEKIINSNNYTNCQQLTRKFFAAKRKYL